MRIRNRRQLAGPFQEKGSPALIPSAGWRSADPWRKQGLGAAVIQRLEQAAREQGAREAATLAQVQAKGFLRSWATGLLALWSMTNIVPMFPCARRWRASLSRLGDGNASPLILAHGRAGINQSRRGCFIKL